MLRQIKRFFLIKANPFIFLTNYTFNIMFYNLTPISQLIPNLKMQASTCIRKSLYMALYRFKGRKRFYLQKIEDKGQIATLKSYS